MLVKPLYTRARGDVGGKEIGAPLDRHQRFSKRSKLATAVGACCDAAFRKLSYARVIIRFKR
jgi:hypothetical protein